IEITPFILVIATTDEGSALKSEPTKLIYDLAKIHGEIFEIRVGLQRQIVLSSAELIEQLNVPSANGNFIIRYAYHEGLEAWGTDTGITFNQVGDLIERMEHYWKELGSDCVLDLNA
ncbi:2984_t:CDS:2, partial [Ambispora leptoticha]